MFFFCSNEPINASHYEMRTYETFSLESCEDQCPEETSETPKEPESSDDEEEQTPITATSHKVFEKKIMVKD